MNRWTERDESGIAYIKNFYAQTHGLQASENLAAYEATGLTPEEISTMKAQLDKAIKDIPHKCWKCRYAHCNTGNDCDLAHYVGGSPGCQRRF